jgi:hypothetical protein
MCSRADQVQVVAVDFVEQEPIRFDVAVPMMFPVAAKRVVLVGEAAAFLNEVNIDIQELYLKMDKAFPGALQPLPAQVTGKRIELKHSGDKEKYSFKGELGQSPGWRLHSPIRRPKTSACGVQLRLHWHSTQNAGGRPIPLTIAR